MTYRWLDFKFQTIGRQVVKHVDLDPGQAEALAL